MKRVCARLPLAASGCEAPVCCSSNTVTWKMTTYNDQPPPFIASLFPIHAIHSVYFDDNVQPADAVTKKEERANDAEMRGCAVYIGLGLRAVGGGVGLTTFTELFEVTRGRLGHASLRRSSLATTQNTHSCTLQRSSPLHDGKLLNGCRTFPTDMFPPPDVSPLLQLCILCDVTGLPGQTSWGLKKRGETSGREKCPRGKRPRLTGLGGGNVRFPIELGPDLARHGPTTLRSVHMSSNNNTPCNTCPHTFQCCATTVLSPRFKASYFFLKTQYRQNYIFQSRRANVVTKLHLLSVCRMGTKTDMHIYVFWASSSPPAASIHSAAA